MEIIILTEVKLTQKDQHHMLSIRCCVCVCVCWREIERGGEETRKRWKEAILREGYIVEMRESMYNQNRKEDNLRGMKGTSEQQAGEQWKKKS